MSKTAAPRPAPKAAPSSAARPVPRQQSERLAYTLLGLVSLAYLGVTLWSPVSTAAHTYSLSPRAIHSLEATIILPVIAVWFIALWGSLRFRRYALSILPSPDGEALKWVANGLIVLVSGLAVTSALQSLNPHMLRWGHIRGWTILNEYIAVVVGLAAMILIARGAWQLAGIVGFRSLRSRNVALLVALTVLGVLFGWVLAHDPYRTTSSDPSHYSSYYLPDWLLLLTLVLPYLATWYLGLLAAACLRIYQSYSSGIIYRQSLSRLSIGLVTVIGTSILIQLLDATSASLSHLGLRDILFLLYGLILIYAAGHIMIASGARKLSRIEEVDSK